jgi:hypothetical protein
VIDYAPTKSLDESLAIPGDRGFFSQSIVANRNNVRSDRLPLALREVV